MPVFCSSGRGIRQVAVGTVNVYDGSTGSSIGRVYAHREPDLSWVEHWVLFDRSAFLEMKGIRLVGIAEQWGQPTLDALRQQAAAAGQTWRYIKMSFRYEPFPAADQLTQFPSWLDEGVTLAERRLVNGGTTTGWLHREIAADWSSGVDYWVFASGYVPPTSVDEVACGYYSGSFRSARHFFKTRDGDRAGAPDWQHATIRWRIEALPTKV